MDIVLLYVLLMLSPCIKYSISSYYTLHDPSLSQTPTAIKSEAERHLDKLRDPRLRAEALRDHDTVTFDTASDLQHGDTVVTYHWVHWGLVLYEHWWLFDQRNNQVIGMKFLFRSSALSSTSGWQWGAKRVVAEAPWSRDCGSGVLDSSGFQG